MEKIDKKRKRNESAVKQRSGQWNFEVDYNDHFETPVVSYEDLLPWLETMASSLGKALKDVVVYDPYWCQGNMVARLKSIGIENVINENRDFYKDIQQKKVPDFDILITNPPYSGEHKPRLIEFLKKMKKPFALLLPCYTATKSYWRQFAESAPLSRDSPTGPGEASPSSHIMYILPPDSYEYHHPEGTGKEVPPFYSAWFVGGQAADAKARAMARYRSAKAGRQCAVQDSVDQLVRLKYVADKRPNPKARKKLKKLMACA